MKRRTLWVMCCMVIMFLEALSQQQVNVTFRWKPLPSQTGPYYVVGDFNGWNNTQLPLNYAGDGLYTRTVTLNVGGTPGGVPGAILYKFYHNGAATWPNDPLNPRYQSDGNANSILYIKNPTIYHFLPNARSSIVRDAQPVISAYVYPAVGSPVDTGTIVVRVDTTTYTGIGASYNPATQLFTYKIPQPLLSGQHSVWLTVGSNIDSVTFTLQAGYVQITNVSGFATRNPQRTLYGSVEDLGITDVKVIRNGIDTFSVTASSGKFTLGATLTEGVNEFRAAVVDTLAVLHVSDPVNFTYTKDHRPRAHITTIDAGSNLILSGQGSIDPDSGQTAYLTYRWEVLPGNPDTLSGVQGATTSQVSVPKPPTSGEYLVRLIVSDSTGLKDTTRSFFQVASGGAVAGATMATVPQWVKNGRMYTIFFKSLTPEGTINAALPYLSYIRNLGANIIWVLPVMENAYPIDNGVGPGYNIKNFLKIAPEYGTNADFKNFVQQAHALGLRVIVDVTPNHTSFAHPWVEHARLFRENSPYWNSYVHSIISHNTNGLGQSLTADGFNYYSGFSDQLLNYNWADLDARLTMTDIYDWWVNEFDIDGYRFDVYWGPRRRTNNGIGGEQEMGIPVRQALKHRKADIYLLAEDDGTGSGTEVIYADQNGGVDSGYDWPLYHNAIKNFNFTPLAVDNLHTRLSNSGYVPGPNASFMRFLENHDEDRISSVYGSYEKTKPVATAYMLAPGMPMIYAGQEVGFGLGISNYDGRRRGVIDWNFGGKPVLQAHYQRLATIRGTFPAFWGQQMSRLTTGNGLVYAYARPFSGENALVVANASASQVEVSFSVPVTQLTGTVSDGVQYVLSDVYNDSTYQVTPASGNVPVQLSLAPYGSAVLLLAQTARTLTLPSLTGISDAVTTEMIPSTFQLHQNYPNPFNPSTEIRYEIPVRSDVTIAVYNILGIEVSRLVDGQHAAGSYRAVWNGRNSNGSSVSSGVYFVRLQSGSTALTRKMVLVK
ncbi:MAG: hypothetical protein A3G43_01680 [Ignavibacteria bacterium RIFCSPLOWO2_12_FULL_56_21]|nr:MAG: hypothetical protein A3G43_01680 [Ignavibacteria bacterium RIFCSPLOWO2_12_FULL_56_21]